MIEIFSKVGDTVFCVSFQKQPDSKDIQDALASINKGRILSNKDIADVVKTAYKGNERLLTGYLIKTETGFGRSMCIDLNIDMGNKPNYDERIRQVDHRTLNWLIYKGVKYSVKK